MLFGLILIFLSGGYFVSVYVNGLKRRCKEYKNILSLLLDIQSSLSVSTHSVAKIFSDSDSDIIKKCGFIEKRYECDGRGEMYAESQSEAVFKRDGARGAKLDVDKEDSDIFFSYIKDFGKTSLLSEEEKLCKVIAYFEKREVEVRASCEKDIKVAWVLFASAFVGIAIFVI